MIRSLRLGLLALPLVGLAGAWIVTHYRAQQGTEWEVPVSGYDPRDLLRGHYIQYQYDWPRLERAEHDAAERADPELCIIGQPPVISQVRQAKPDQNCANRAVAPAEGRWDWGPVNRWTGRLYVPQTQARAMEAKLRDPKLQAVVRFRLRPDGHVTPLAMTFRKRAGVP
jgi:hypothetical protein